MNLNTEMLRRAMYYSDECYNGLSGAMIHKVSSKITSAEAYLVGYDHLQILVFCGTKDPIDWLVDLTAFPVKYGNGWCHAGFALSLYSVWSDISRHIRHDTELLITGHSLGGGMAEKAADFTRGMRAPVHLITFGKPNVHLKNHAPRLAYLKTQLSVVDGSDIVARVPRLFYGPDRGQNMLYLANNGIDYLNPEGQFIKDDWHYQDSITDHSMEIYKKRIIKLIEVMKQ